MNEAALIEFIASVKKLKYMYLQIDCDEWTVSKSYRNALDTVCKPETRVYISEMNTRLIIET